MDLFVREAQIDDAEAIVNLLNPIIEAGVYTALTTPFSIEAEQEFISNFPRQGIFLVAVWREQQKIVGCQNVEPFATYSPAFAHVGVIGTFVDLSHRRQGVAKSLFPATFEAARDKGYEKLFSFVRADNAAALATYLSQGFYRIGTARRHAKINGIYIDEIMIERFL
ncbi:GNAT family N-acetyltransferase [Nostoc sp. FACHB-152]|uniref:GNAT family N-acetyltransferase n=1 Tax=Nostoc sp. FACHB-152 TaxID=2692837 RepID=UPI001682DDBF|nr:GNAT family N-acetyltransferase [Nostoc sp. FACHB-152]MBD2450521.1 GNAT family N-acetyltransferase [Nostoc sp. FACHB-152]